MLWRHLCLVRAGLATGLITGFLTIGASPATAQTRPSAPADSEPTSLPAAAKVVTETVDLLEGRNGGDLDVVARGQGQDRVRLTIQNRSKRRLNVVIPPGLVAASTVAQGPGGAAGGGRLQSMGLGSVTNRSGAFGEFRETAGDGGLRSVSLTDASRSRAVAVPVGETIELTIPAVCLNYGLPSPTPRHTFRLVDVNEYSSNPFVRKALRSLATYGTSLGVAQAVMWRVCNDLSFDLMAEQTGKVMNLHEIALAARFVEALEASSSSDLVDPTALTQSRVFIQVRGERNLAAEAKRLCGELDGLRILGMPVQVVTTEDTPSVAAPALYLNVFLTDAKTGDTSGKVVVSSCSALDAWSPLGKVAFRDNSSISVLDGPTLARVVDRAISSAFVSVKPAKRTPGSTTLKIENRLPFTLSRLVVKAGTSLGSPSVAYEGAGVGPARSALLPIEAATASLVEHVELNGL